jgi:hypothetical protein
VELELDQGNYRFVVAAVNSVGRGPFSERSTKVKAR